MSNLIADLTSSSQVNGSLSSSSDLSAEAVVTFTGGIKTDTISNISPDGVSIEGVKIIDQIVYFDGFSNLRPMAPVDNTGLLLTVGSGASWTFEDTRSLSWNSLETNSGLKTDAISEYNDNAGITLNHKVILGDIPLDKSESYLVGIDDATGLLSKRSAAALSYWDRTETVLSPENSGDDIHLDGLLKTDVISEYTTGEGVSINNDFYVGDKNGSNSFLKILSIGAFAFQFENKTGGWGRGLSYKDGTTNIFNIGAYGSNNVVTYGYMGQAWNNTDLRIYPGVREIFYHKVNMPDLPTSASGLSSGDLWNNSGVINIV